MLVSKCRKTSDESLESFGLGTLKVLEFTLYEP